MKAMKVCECGCGRETKPAKMTSAKRGTVKGQPQRFLLGHGGRRGWPRITGKRHGSWRGGRVTKRGYIYVHVGREHPMANAQGYVAEHRLVASATLGRPLTIDEHVHHVNEVKDDNRPENLEVLTASEHNQRHGRGDA